MALFAKGRIEFANTVRRTRLAARPFKSAETAQDGFVFSTVQIDRDSGLPALPENFDRAHSFAALATDTRLLTPSS